MFELKIDGSFSPDAILKELGLDKGGPVQTAIDQAVVEYAKPYWAWDTGHLANSATGIGTGEITYTADYAWEMYYGQREDGTPVNYHTEKNPMAGPYPIERMATDHLDDIIQEAQEVVNNQQY